VRATRSLHLLLVIAGCSTPATPPPSPAPPPVVRAVLAEADCANPRVRVQVTEVVRTAPEAVTVKFRLLNPDKTAPVSVGDSFADAPGEAGSIGGVHLVDSTGLRKVFVLRDDQGRPLCSVNLGPIPPGGALEAWARFPAPAPDATRVGVQVPGLAAFRDLPVADGVRGTGSTGPSY
jgi:hypothetical protein